MLELDKIYNMDCLEGMKQLPNDSIDLVITSPPYEDITGAGYSAKNKDILFFKLYSEFIEDTFKELYRIIKPTGQIFFNIKTQTHNKTIRTPHWLEFLDSFQQFKLKSYIIWKYAGSFDSTNKRFHLDYEIIYHLSKTDDITLNENCGIADALTSVWYVPHNISNRLHPTQMPEALVERILKVSGKPGDIILDIFSGAGTTQVVAKNYGFNWLGFEIDPEYCKVAEKRVSEVKTIQKHYIEG